MDRRNSFFNPSHPQTLHIDLNSCFATVEQQANPLLRGRPIGVAAYTTPNGCVLAPSVEAKWFGCKTGMSVKDCRQLCPEIIILPPDPHKYRYVHLRFKELLERYSPLVFPKSIDEFVLDLHGSPHSAQQTPLQIAKQIKQQIKTDLGKYLTVSIGISTNRTLAKLAANLNKPDGLDTIDQQNYWRTYQQLQLTDLPGINLGYQARLAKFGIHTIPQMLSATLPELRQAFGGVVGEDWFARLRGWEVDAVEFNRRSFSNTHALKTPLIHQKDIFPVMNNLLWKASSRMRLAGLQARTLHLHLRYQHGCWHKQHWRSAQPVFSSTLMLKQLQSLFWQAPHSYVTNIEVSLSELSSRTSLQLDWLNQPQRQQDLYQAIDQIEHNFGRNTIHPASMLPAKNIVLNRIPFGGGKEMEQYLLNGDDLS